VTLTVTDDGGLGDTATHMIAIEELVLNQPPMAVINGPRKGVLGELLTFDGSSSSDLDGAILSYTWDFGDGTTDRGINVSHSYSPAGTYNVTLTVTDDDGLSDTSTYTLLIEEQVVNQPPVAVISGPTNALVGEPLTFNGSGSSDSDGAIVDYTWAFDDGSSASGVNVEHTFQAIGDYLVTLTVTDDGGLTHSASLTVHIDQPPPPNQPPTAAISGPTNGLVGEPLSFGGRGSSDSDRSIVSYAWDFGDGATGDGISVSHSYSQAGDYQVTLTVTDDGGLTHTAGLTVHIDQPPPPNQPPTAAISGPTSGLVGEPLTFDGSGSNDSDGRITSYDWDLGDGAVHSGKNVTHKYGAAGSYEMSLTVTDDGGLTASTSHTVQIE
jgi:PKD repeat protein